jgi:hypothetical protein
MTENKFIKTTGKIGHYLVAGSLIISGALKLIGLEPYHKMINELSPHYSENIYLLGIIAIGCGILFLFPRTLLIGFIATLVFLGGTISAHMQHGDPYIPQIIFVLFAVFAVYTQKSEWFQNSKKEEVKTV